MDVPTAVTLLQRLLEAGLAIESRLTEAGYVVTLTGGRRPVSGVGDSYLDAFSHACWRWTN